MDSRQAFGPHCDEHDVFAIHFEGEKVWNVYENIEKNPINHPAFKFDSQERVKRAGKLIDQVTLKPGDLLYLPRGQYHDALASKNGAMHIAFGLTYFKPIDLMSVIWEKLIFSDFMREDINQNITRDEFNFTLKKLSKELEIILNEKETCEVAFNSMKNWRYKIQNYSLKKIISEGRKYKVSNIVRIEKIGNDSFLVSGKDKVSIPSLYSEVTEYILKQEFITYESLCSHFNKLDKKIVSDCIEKLNSMKVIN
jgi:ribosomal protein L16 Arg81 hydroxylase